MGFQTGLRVRFTRCSLEEFAWCTAHKAAQPVRCIVALCTLAHQAGAMAREPKIKAVLGEPAGHTLGVEGKDWCHNGDGQEKLTPPAPVPHPRSTYLPHLPAPSPHPTLTPPHPTRPGGW